MTMDVYLAVVVEQKGFRRSWNGKDGVLAGLWTHGFRSWLHIIWSFQRISVNAQTLPQMN